jgi:hypothetical protein
VHLQAELYKMHTPVHFAYVATYIALLLQPSCAWLTPPSAHRPTALSRVSSQMRWLIGNNPSSCRSSVTMKAVDANGVMADQPTPVIRRMFGGLSASAFQHPFDSDATSTLRRLPGLEAIVRSFIPVIEVSFSPCMLQSP